MHILNLLIYEATFLLTFNTDLFTIIRYNKKFTNSTIIKLISVQNESLYYVPNRRIKYVFNSYSFSTDNVFDKIRDKILLQFNDK